MYTVADEGKAHVVIINFDISITSKLILDSVSIYLYRYLCSAFVVCCLVDTEDTDLSVR